MKSIQFNIDNGSLGSYHVGSRPPTKLNNEHFHNYDDGYSIAIFENVISAILVCFRNGYRDFKKFKGDVVIQGNNYELGTNSSLEDIISIFGNPNVHWNDGVEECVEYQLDECEVEIIWHVDGEITLDYISIEPSTKMREKTGQVTCS